MGNEALLAKIAADPRLPTLPVVAMRVVQMASQPDCTLTEIASLVGQDPALCARILKLVNSAFYNLPRAITSIDRSLHLLGLRRVRSLILGLSVPSVQRRTAAHPWMREYWKASVAAAIAASELAGRGGQSEADDALVCSLLCDLGSLVLLEMFPDRYARVLALAPADFLRRQCELEAELFGFDHATLSAYLLRSWGLPEDMTEAIRLHHHSGPALGIGQRAKTLAFASRIGQLQLAPDEHGPFLDLVDFAREYHGLDQQQLMTFLEPLQEKVKQLAAFLHVDIGPVHHYPNLLANAAAQLARLASETALDNIRISEEKSEAESAARRGEEALEQLGLEHELILDAATEGIYGLDLEGRITFANVASARMLGWETQELVGIPAATMFAPESGTPATPPESLCAALGRGETVHVENALFARKDGARFPVAHTCSPIRKRGRIVGAVVTFRDMTEQRRMEASIRQTNKMEAIGQFAGGVAHDFNNLLTVILGCAELLTIPGMPPDRSKGFVSEITKAGQQAAELTRQLLAFSRRQVLAPRVISLNVVIKDMEKLLRRLIGANIRLASALAPDLGHVLADPGQVEQVILNLAVNARDAMSGGGQLTFETANVEIGESSRHFQDIPPGHYAMVVARDTGCGMDESTQARIFEPFFTTKKVGEGTGMGLATVYGIVKQSDGFIRVHSQRGKGTRFEVFLPLVEAPAAPPAQAVEDGPGPAGTGTILVVEDQAGVRRLVQNVLLGRGYTVLEAGNGQEAIEVSDRHAAPIHLLLTDLVMPRMGGAEAADAITSRRPGIKVLFMSGYTDDAALRNDLSAREAAFLQKPFTTAGLARKVREVLGAADHAPAAASGPPAEASSALQPALTS